ncbi:MAG TPA: MEDS domain-containing protein [Kofleriaceae bacterium]|jgi:hypothetical protein
MPRSALQPGDHYCGIFRSDEDQRTFVVDFVREGIARHEKMLYLVNLQSPEQLRGTLTAAGIAVDALIERHQLVILTAKEAYLKDGSFEPDRMIELLKDETDKALADGYAAMRATGEMTWALAGEPGSELVVEYESRLNEFFPGTKCIAVCQYDRRKFDAEMLLDMLHTHPKVLFGKDAYDNSHMYYVPPETFRERDRQSATLDTWLKNLTLRWPSADCAS